MPFQSLQVICRAKRTRLYQWTLAHPVISHMVHSTLHVAYFTLVFLDGHGMYSYISGVLAITTVVETVKRPPRQYVASQNAPAASYIKPEVPHGH